MKLSLIHYNKRSHHESCSCKFYLIKKVFCDCQIIANGELLVEQSPWQRVGASCRIWTSENTRQQSQRGAFLILFVNLLFFEIDWKYLSLQTEYNESELERQKALERVEELTRQVGSVSQQSIERQQALEDAENRAAALEKKTELTKKKYKQEVGPN